MKLKVFFWLVFLFINTTVCSAQTFSSRELNQILEKVKSKKIIGLGESDHFRKGFYKSKFEVIRYLVEQGAINTIAIEGSMNVTSMLNKYINGDTSINLPKALLSLNEPYSLQGVGLFNCSEIVEMIEWLKKYNENHIAKIKLLGIDFQNYSIPLNQLKHKSSAPIKEKAANAKLLLDSSMFAILDSNMMVTTSAEWVARLQKARQYIQDIKPALYNERTKDLFQELEQFSTVWDDPMFPRDSMMYENLKSFMEEKTRVLVWAHNFHLENDKKMIKKLGFYLKENYKEQYYIIGVIDDTKNKDERILEPKDNFLNKYDLIINIEKGDKCNIL